MTNSTADSKYAHVAPDTRGHASWFLSRTNKEHQATMDHPFMKTIYARNFDRNAYSQYLLGQYFVFRELERLCAAQRRGEVPLAAVEDEALWRTKALELDLLFWHGPGWQAAEPSAATCSYLERLRADASDPWMLLCHHFLQYNAVLSGGQFLGSQVSTRAQTEEARSDSAALSGACFYDFPDSCMPTHARVQRYIDDMDQLQISESVRGRMLTCMREVYARILAQFDEAFAIAPIEGVAYKSTGSNADAKGKEVPLPMEPGEQSFTLAELKEHHANQKARPTLTAVLGRVYDVTWAKDLFGPKAPYEMFTGHDGTYNLAVMSLKAKTLDKFEYELDDEEKECIADWLAYFDNKYGQPIGVLADRKHAVSLQDIPRAKKIPFEGIDDDDEDEDEQPPATESAPRSRL